VINQLPIEAGKDLQAKGRIQHADPIGEMVHISAFARLLKEIKVENAAKVYRPREFRNLRNDKMYREGRPILTAAGRRVKKTDHRLLRAVGKKTEFGVQVEHTSWLMYEYTTLKQLHDAGAAVREPQG